MSAKYFLDTNIFAYCFDDRDPAKKERSLSLIAEALQTGSGIISRQVVQEFLNIATRKFSVPLKIGDARIYLQKVLDPLCQVFPDSGLYQAALELQNETGYGFYDCLILASAGRGECSLVYSEDMQDGRRIAGIEIRNPFI